MSWRRPTKVVPNGEHNSFEIHWSPLIKWGAPIVGSLLVAGVVGVVKQQWELSTQIAELRVRQDLGTAAAALAAAQAAVAAESVSADLKVHIKWSQDTLPTLATKDDLLHHTHKGRVPAER